MENQQRNDVSLRAATSEDLESIIRMLAEDRLGAEREEYRLPLPEAYREAFDAIEEDPYNELLVAVDGEEVIGVLQLTVIPNLTYCGRWRAQIEGVRVAHSHRSAGVGRQMFLWAIDRARERGCHLVQLTTDRSRPDARRFYEGLGFVASHDGMKLHLDRASG